MEGVHDNASAFMHLNIKSKKYWVKLTFQTKLSHLCQKAIFLNFMVMQIRKPENEGTFLGSNENKHSGKELNKTETRLAERKQEMNSWTRKC